MDGTVVLATVTAVANDDGASVSFDPGNQVDLSAGRNEVTITVTAEDGVTTREYTVSVNRGETGAKGWQAGADLDGLRATGNDNPYGVWSDGTTMWVADDDNGKLYAYRVSDGTRGRRPGHRAGGPTTMIRGASGRTGLPCGWRTTPTASSTPTACPTGCGTPPGTSRWGPSTVIRGASGRTG